MPGGLKRGAWFLFFDNIFRKGIEMKYKMDCEVSSWWGDRRVESKVFNANDKEDADKRAKSVALEIELKSQGIRGATLRDTAKITGVYEFSG